ncbi:MAG: chorismate synthase, partial [Deltaproteobacteria bacterium]|nr:chorismate synthase [Deltaproteobacteria bacterium]
KTTGAPICFLIRNQDVKSEDYKKLKDAFRPGHADFTFLKKYGIRDYRGGGRSSGRETVARVAAGALAKRMLGKEGIRIKGFVREIAGIGIGSFDEKEITGNPLMCPDNLAAKKMARAILKAKKEGNSVGGVVEVHVKGVPPGLGDPVFDKLNARLGHALLSIGGVKGVEFGDGFAIARMRGSESNDRMGGRGFSSNHLGGITGGISTGQDIVFRIAVKPPSSIAKKQKTVNSRGKEVQISVKGRHDPCLCPRIVPVAESMAAIVILDALLRQKAVEGRELLLEDIRALIDGCDEIILETIARRMNLAERAAEMKRRDNKTIRDKTRENEVLKKWKKLAGEFRLDGQLIKNLAKMMFSLSIKRQKQHLYP